jgi:hypothetical protein
MKGKRTGVDFSKHEVTIIQNNNVAQIIQYAKPDTRMDSLIFINAQGVMTVTGDYNNWVFSREFRPSKKEDANYVSDPYWMEKLRNSSCQTISKYDSEETAKEIREYLDGKDLDDGELTNEERSYLEDCLRNVEDELAYLNVAYRENVGRFEDGESVIFTKKPLGHLLVVIDAWECMCQKIAQMANHSKNMMF